MARKRPMPDPAGFRRYVEYELLVAREAALWFLQWFKSHPILSVEGLIVCVAIAWFTGLEAAETYMIQFLATAATFCLILYLWGSVRASYDVWSKLDYQKITLQHEIANLKQSKTNVQIIKDRQKWRKEFETHIPYRKDGMYGRVIIRDVARVDSYPDLNDEEKGISPWFRVEFKGLYHRGVEVNLNIESIAYDEQKSKWHRVRYDATGAINALIVGRIPFDVVHSVQWDGDEYYSHPHIYCEFSKAEKQPYEEIVVFVPEGQGEHRFYREITNYSELD